MLFVPTVAVPTRIMGVWLLVMLTLEIMKVCPVRLIKISPNGGVHTEVHPEV